MDIHHFSVLLCLLSWGVCECCSGRRTHRRRGKVPNLSALRRRCFKRVLIGRIVAHFLLQVAPEVKKVLQLFNYGHTVPDQLR